MNHHPFRCVTTVRWGCPPRSSQFPVTQESPPTNSPMEATPAVKSASQNQALTGEKKGKKKYGQSMRRVPPGPLSSPWRRSRPSRHPLIPPWRRHRPSSPRRRTRRWPGRRRARRSTGPRFGTAILMMDSVLSIRIRGWYCGTIAWCESLTNIKEVAWRTAARTKLPEDFRAVQTHRPSGLKGPSYQTWIRFVNRLIRQSCSIYFSLKETSESCTQIGPTQSLKYAVWLHCVFAFC